MACPAVLHARQQVAVSDLFVFNQDVDRFVRIELAFEVEEDAVGLLHEHWELVRERVFLQDAPQCRDFAR